MGILRQCRLAGIANSKWIPILHEDMSKNEKDQPSGSNPWLLGSYHLPAPRDQRGHPRSNPHVGKGTRPKKRQVTKRGGGGHVVNPRILHIPHQISCHDID